MAFADFSIKEVRQFAAELDQARTLFSQATYGDCIYERQYADIPPPRLAYGFGRIPTDVEDTLLLLRLYKPGDIAFVEMKIRRPDGTIAIQDRYGATGDITSSLFYDFGPADIAQWEAFANQLRQSGSWNSDWFKIARHFFLYGGSKGYSVEWDEVDRIMDYMIALEAALVPDKQFVGSCLRNRATNLIAGNDATLRFFKHLYGVRSTIAHGSELDKKQKEFLTNNRVEIESIIRKVLVTAVLSIPAGKVARKQYLTAIYTPTDDDFAEEARKSFDSITNHSSRNKLLIALLKSQSYSFWNFLKLAIAVLRK